MVDRPRSFSTENWLERQARAFPRALALVSDEDVYTFEDLAHAARIRAAQLEAVLGGLRPAGSGRPGPARPGRVALLAGNCAEYVLWLVAAQLAGVESVPLNIRLSVPELAAQLADCRPGIVLCDEGRAEAARRAVGCAGKALATRALTFGEALRIPTGEPAAPPSGGCRPYDLDRVCDIVYTSGSTGRPKGVVQTLGNHWHSAVNCCLNLGFGAGSDLWGCPTPLFHMSGFSIVMRMLVCGVGVRLYDRFDARAVNDDALAGRITCLSAVTYQIERMLDDLASRPGAPSFPPSLRFVLQGGGPLPPSTLHRCEAFGMRVVQSFGMTETASQVVSLSPADAALHPGSSGRPLASVQLRIAPRDGASDDQAAPGTQGRILLKSPTLAIGYLNQPERYRASFTEGGWFDTGDLGHVDDRGYLYVVCRRSDLIISGGENVYPAEVEEALRRHPLVARALVAGVPDPRWGTVPAALCVPRGMAADAPGLPGPEEMRAFCRESLAAYKCPRTVVWVDELPLTASGKPRRTEAARMLAAAPACRPDAARRDPEN